LIECSINGEAAMRGGLLAGLAAAVVLASSAGAAAQTAVARCSSASPDGTRTLCHEAVLDAPVSEVWALWTTADGLRSWAAPVVSIDARPGGLWEASYNPQGHIGDGRNIQNRIIAAQPNALLIMQVAAAPPGFAHPNEVRDLLTVIELDAIDAQHTRARVSMHGYREGAAFDDLYRFFDWGNAYSLEKLQQRIVHGPVDWSAEAATPNSR
jgi:uncharacterized protein YndB with AHSA1/START domain